MTLEPEQCRYLIRHDAKHIPAILRMVALILARKYFSDGHRIATRAPWIISSVMLRAHDEHESLYIEGIAARRLPIFE